jgi:hypothetical protein
MLRRNIIFDRANPLHRRGLVMIVELSFDAASAIPAFCPLDISSIGFEFIDEGNGVDLHEPGDVARVSPFAPAIKVANNRVHPKPVGADIEMKNVSPFPTDVARR